MVPPCNLVEIDHSGLRLPRDAKASQSWFARAPNSSNISDGQNRFDLKAIEKFGIGQKKVHWQSLLKGWEMKDRTHGVSKTGSWEFSHRAFQKECQLDVQWTFRKCKFLFLFRVWNFNLSVMSIQWCNLTATAFTFSMCILSRAGFLYITLFLYFDIELRWMFLPWGVTGSNCWFPKE